MSEDKVACSLCKDTCQPLCPDVSKCLFANSGRKIIATNTPHPNDHILPILIEKKFDSKFIKIPFPKPKKENKQSLTWIEPDPDSMRVSAMYRTMVIPKSTPPILNLKEAELENIRETKKILEARIHINFLCAMQLYFPVEELRSLYRKGMRIKKIHLKYFTLRELVRWWLSEFPEDAELTTEDLCYRATQGFEQNERGMYFFPVRRV